MALRLMRSLWLPMVLLVMLALAPVGAAEGPEDHPHGGPPGHDDGHPGQGDGPGDEASDDTDANETEAPEAAVTTARQGCRLVEWDGGDVEVDDDPLLGILVIDVFRCISTSDAGGEENESLLW